MTDHPILKSLGLVFFMLIIQGCSMNARTITTPVNVTPIIDDLDLGMFVFDQTEASLGWLSFDGGRFQPLHKLPKFDATSLEYGLFTEQSGYYISPDGKWIGAIIGYDQLVLVDAIADQRYIVAHVGAGGWLNWAPDSRMFAYREEDSRVCWYRLSEQTTNCMDEFEGKVIAGSWSLDSSILALSIATQAESSTPGTVDGTVWLVNSITEQAQFVTNQNLPLGSPSTDHLLLWTTSGLIVHHTSSDEPAILVDADHKIQLPANAVTVSPSGNYVVYESGNVERAHDRAVLSHLPVCPATKKQSLRVVWPYDESGLAYTLHCMPDNTMQLGLVRFDSDKFTWTRTIPDTLRLMGWFYDNDYLFFRRMPDNPQMDGYKIERLGTDLDSTFEQVADSVFLIDILSQGSAR
jgi:hypothetical protein